MTTEAPPKGAMTATDGKQKSTGLKAMLGDPKAKARFEEILGRKAPAFISSIISAWQTNDALQKVEPESIIAAAAMAAALDLPINANLGHAAIVPYSGKAQFQIMWKGYVQLALRTKEYKRIHLARVYEGQLVSYDEFTGKVTLDATKKKSDRVAGYYFYFELLNGYTHEAYWSATRCVTHGWKYSKSFRLYSSGQWVDDPLLPKDKQGKVTSIKDFAGYLTENSGTDAMCAKTVVKNEISKWGPLSTDLQTAATFDQAAIRDGEGDQPVADYIDTTAEPGTGKAEGAEKVYELPTATEAAAPKEAQGQAPAAKEEAPAIQSAVFAVDSVASTTKMIEGRDQEVTFFKRKDGAKFYTQDESVIKLGAQARDKKTQVKVDFEVRGALNWILQAEKA